MAKAAFAAWDDRIAPVFDAARQIYLVEVRAGQVVSETQEVLADHLPVQRALRLAELGVGTLVCGAISRPLHDMVVANGIRVIPFVAGDLGDVVRAWLAGIHDWDVFAMPGCHRRGRSRGMHNLLREDSMMNRSSGMGRGGGGGQGRGGGRGMGRMGGSGKAGPGGECICPQCGEKTPHKRGVPCFDQKCPKCGTVMARG